MRKLMMALVALFAFSAVHAQGIEFRTESYAEVLKMAKQQQKLVFIDIYTSWCGPCQHMAKEIFTQQKAGDFFNAHFLCLKLDAEKSADGKAVASRFQVNGYPTMLFLDGDGELIYRMLGGRLLDQFVADGQKALDAYAAKPLLEKNAKLYAEGKRDKAFLLEYYALKDKAGLDCSDILLDYFAQVNDKELLDSLNVACIAKVTTYDPGLAKRWVKAVSQGVKANPDKKFMNQAKKSLCTYLGACLKDAAKSDDPKKLEEVLGLKAKLFEKAGIAESVTMATLGGGNIYIASNLLRLDYYEHKHKKELFVPLFEKYAQEVIEDYRKKATDREKAEAELDKKMAEAKVMGDEKEYAAIKKMRGMMNVFSGMDDYYLSSQMVNYIETYAEYYGGVKDRAFEDKIVSLYQDLHRIHPSVKAAVYVADKLVELGRRPEAIEVLELAWDKGQNAMGVEPSDREACQKKLEELRWAQKAEKGIRFLEGEKWEKVLELATREGKCIFMDCYTSWCGPCKALAKDVFTREDVGDFFNANFINVKYDMEKGEGKVLREKYKEHIIGYPTLLLLNSEGEVQHRMAGFHEGEELIAGMKAGKEGESLFALQKRYQQGERDLAFLKKYMTALNGAFLKEDMEKVVHEYMNRMPLDSLKNKEIWDFVWTYIKDPYSPQFVYVVDNLTHYRYKMETDIYKLESQLVYALGRAVRECTALKKDKKGNITGLTDEPEKMKAPSELLGKADLKQRAEYRAKLRIHELELKEEWEKVYEYLMTGYDLGTLESELYLDDVFQYMAFRCPDTKLLKKVLTVVEGLQQKEDQSTKRMKQSYYQTLGMLHEKLGNTSKAKAYFEKEEKRTEEIRKSFEQMMQKN